MITKTEKAMELVKKFEDKKQKIVAKYEKKKNSALMKIGVNPAYTCEDCHTLLVNGLSFLEFPKEGSMEEDCAFRMVVCPLCGKVNYFKLTLNGEIIDNTMRVTDSVVRVKYNSKDFKGTGIHMPLYFRTKQVKNNEEKPSCDENGHMNLVN